MDSDDNFAEMFIGEVQLESTDMTELGLKQIARALSLRYSEKTKAVVAQYDSKVLVPYLVKVHKILNPNGVPAPAEDSTPPSILFGAPATSEEASRGLLISEPSLFRRLTVSAADAEASLTWWKANASRFSTIAYLALQILAIPGSQIESERIFSVAGVLTSLRRCRLDCTNLDSLVMIYKNWPDNARHGCEIA